MSQLTHFLAALVGGAVVAAVLLLTGAGDDGPQTLITGGAGLANPTQNALSPREIYKRDAPGVVFITANVTQASSPFAPEQEGHSTARAS